MLWDGAGRGLRRSNAVRGGARLSGSPPLGAQWRRRRGGRAREAGRILTPGHGGARCAAGDGRERLGEVGLGGRGSRRVAGGALEEAARAAEAGGVTVPGPRGYAGLWGTSSLPLLMRKLRLGAPALSPHPPTCLPRGAETVTQRDSGGALCEAAPAAAPPAVAPLVFRAGVWERGGRARGPKHGGEPRPTLPHTFVRLGRGAAPSCELLDLCDEISERAFHLWSFFSVL